MSDPKATRSPPALFTPFALRSVSLRNRIVVSPMCQYVAREGAPNEWHMAHHARFALGGVGACLVEATAVTRDGRITHGCTGLWADAQIEPMSRIAALHRAHGVVPGIQIGHAGGKGATQRPWEGAGPLPETGPEPAWETVGASAVPVRPGWRPPRPLRLDEIPGLLRAFAEGARRAVAAGFEIVEVHGAHGYLLHEFLSPLTNRREDAYGGDLAGRMRLAVEASRAVREAVPAHLPVIYRASVTDNAEGGVTLDESVALSRALREVGVDLIDCSAGGITAAVSLLSARLEHGFQVPLAEAVKAGSGLPVMAVGLITDPVAANAIVAEGRADLVALGRELLADPNWAYRAAVVLDHAAPESVLPPAYAFYLERRAAAQGRA